MSERLTACPGLNALAAFVDGQSAAGEAAAVQEHIANCDACLDLVAETLMVSTPVLIARPAGSATSGPPRSWSRGQWAAVAAAVAAVLVAALLVPALGSLPNLQGPNLADLADAAGLGRPVEGRLTGGFTHRPWFAPLAGGQGGAMTSSTAIQLVAGKIRGNLETDGTATRLHAYGVSQLLLRDWAQASFALAAAAREQPKNARYQSDVATLYLERARNGQRPGDLIKALAAAERARLADPRLPEAWFNRALALEQLSLRAQARAAWTDYLARDTSSAWADEARAHLAALEVPVAAAQWPSFEARLRLGVDAALAEQAIRVQATEARSFLETVMWPGWAAAVLAGGSGEVERERLRTMADAFLRITGDTLYRDAVAAVDRAERRGPAAILALAEAHAAYADAAALARQDLFSAAVPKLTVARAQLDAAGSPFAVRAAQDLAGAQYYNRKLADAATMAATVLEVSRAAGYRNLESRATWLGGLVAFGEGRYGDARDSWEQMLAAADRGADVEQQAAAHGLLANLLDYLGDSEPAWQHRRVALVAMEISGATRLRYGLLLSTAGQALKEHDPAAALALQDAVVETAVQSRRPAAIAEALAARASIHAALGLIEKASDDLSAARSEVLGLPDAVLRARIQGTVMLAEVNLLRATNSASVTVAAERAIRWFDNRKETARLLPLYLALGEAWLGRGDPGRARQAASAGIAIFEREQAARPTTSGARSDDGWQLYDVGLRAALAEGDVLAAFGFGDRARSRGLRPAGSAAADLRTLQASLGPGDAVLALNQLRDQLVVWVVTRHDVRHVVRRISQEDAVRMVLRQADEITMAASEPRAATALFREIVRPVRSALVGASRVTVAPDAPYFAASFAGMWNTEGRRFWVEDVQIAVSTRLEAIPRLDQPLGQSAVVDVDASATTEEAVGAWRAASARAVIQLPVLAASNSHLPQLSRVVLADSPGRPYSGTWLARDLPPLPRVRGVVLPNIDAGEQPIFGAGSYDVASAFLDAGTPHVVSVISPVPLDEELAGRLRQRLESNPSMVSAVASFQRDAIRTNGRRLGTWSQVVVYSAGR